MSVTFISENAYWEFARIIRAERRWILDGKAGAFLKALRKTAKSRAETIKVGSRFFRAQLGTDIEDRGEVGEWEHPLPVARMIPDSKHIKSGGRANPAGFAYLYLALDERTALAEMRAWVEESVTLAIFETLKELRLVVCQRKPEDILERYSNTPHSRSKIEQYVWNDIGHAFARPVSRDDQQSEYIPTQILAEAFKSEDFDGIAYQSSLEQGYNVALFDPAAAKLTHRFAYRLKRVRYDFHSIANYGIHRTRNGKDHDLSDIETDSNRQQDKAKT